MDMDEVVAKIEWTIQDLHDAYYNQHGREPTEEELNIILDNLNTEGIEEAGIESGWNVINETVQNEKLFEKIKSQMSIYGFSPFGYEGSTVKVEVDLRRGIPAVDIIGLSDSVVKASRERIRAAFLNSKLDFPPERVLISLSPADLKKDGPGFDFPMAMALAQSKDHPDEKVMVLGELTLSGMIKPCRAIQAAIQTAAQNDINYFIVPKGMNLIFPENVKVLEVSDLKEAVALSRDLENFKSIEKSKTVSNPNEVKFPEIDKDESLGQEFIDKHSDIVKAIEIAVAGKHNILLAGPPGCGKTMALQHLLKELTPELTEEENKSVMRLKSLAGLLNNYSEVSSTGPAPFRMPHQSASIEGMCGGGINCHPGEISLAHNGILFLDEAGEFRSPVLQMLRVPLESKTITLARAGRSTVYPTKFQLAMATVPSPDGNYLAEDRMSLDSMKSIENYWKKFSSPLLNRIEIRNYMDFEGNNSNVKGEDVTIEKMQERIASAYKIQRERGVYNAHLNPVEISKYCQLENSSKELFQNIIDTGLSHREVNNLLKVSLTIANMDGREQIQARDLKEAYSFSMNPKMRTIMNDIFGRSLEELRLKDSHRQKQLLEIGR